MSGGASNDTFVPEMVSELPPAALRYLLHAIAPGTHLARSVELAMHGTIKLDPRRDPIPMTAVQSLAPPDRFIWRARAGKGLMRISGFDRYDHGAGEMRWWLWGLIPVMSASGEDVTRSGAGRLAMESVLIPPALVPNRGAHWEAIDDSTARFHLTVGTETVMTMLTVDGDGRPLRASAMRWRGATKDEPAGYARFDVELEGELRSGGYTIPQRLEAGWGLGEAGEFRFFRATIDRAEFQ